MNVVKKKVFIVYKEYKYWEDDDSNRTELIQAFSERKKAINSLLDEYNYEIQFFDDNEVMILNKQYSNTNYSIETKIGSVLGYLKEMEVI